MKLLAVLSIAVLGACSAANDRQTNHTLSQDENKIDAVTSSEIKGRTYIDVDFGKLANQDELRSELEDAVKTTAMLTTKECKKVSIAVYSNHFESDSLDLPSWLTLDQLDRMFQEVHFKVAKECSGDVIFTEVMSQKIANVIYSFSRLRRTSSQEPTAKGIKHWKKPGGSKVIAIQLNRFKSHDEFRGVLESVISAIVMKRIEGVYDVAYECRVFAGKVLIDLKKKMDFPIWINLDQLDRLMQEVHHKFSKKCAGDVIFAEVGSEKDANITYVFE